MYWSDEALDFPHFLPRQMSLPCCVRPEYSLIRVQFRRIRKNCGVEPMRPAQKSPSRRLLSTLETVLPLLSRSLAPT